MKHRAPEYFYAVPHQITIDLVGLGGTGSQMLSGLARINSALQGLGHPGIFVRAWDPDRVSAANLGRQLFSPADLNFFKANVLISRINRFFGTEWQSNTVKYTGAHRSNIIITCIDTAAGRIKLGETFRKHYKSGIGRPFDIPYYWLDLGNTQFTGQVVLGTFGSVSKQKGYRQSLPDVVKTFPALKKLDEKQQGPSCSLAEALEKQDLFINSTLAQFGCNLLWKLLKEKEIEYRGCFVNLQTLSVNPIEI